MLYHRSWLAIFFVVLALVLPADLAAQQTVAADRFVDSAGVNVHLHYANTLYWDQFPLIKNRLIELGVRHVRDGLIDTTWRHYYDRHNALGEAGIKGAFIIGPHDSVELMAQYPARMSRSFEAYEAPNEYDKSRDPNWVATLRAAMARMAALKHDARSAGYPVLGPALGDPAAYAALGDVSPAFDYANMHNYFAGRHPGTPGWGTGGYGSIPWNLNLVRPYAGGKGVVTTETGYQDDLALEDGLPMEIAGRYMPRVLLEQFRAGIARTYLYELADFAKSGNYGLLYADGTPKPSFVAVKGLLNLLADPGPAFAVTPLGYAVNGGGPELRHMAFQKRDGTYFVALWLARASYDPRTRQTMPMATQAVAVMLPRAMRHLRTHQWQPDGEVAAHPSAATTTMIPVTVSDALTIVELTQPPTGSGIPGAAAAPAANVSYRSVLVHWQPPTSGGAATGYVLEAASRLDFADALSMPVGPEAQLYVPNVAPGVYFVRVRAGNAHGWGAASSATEISIGAPDPPQLVATQATANPIALAWTPTAGAQRYLVSAGTAPGTSDVAIMDMGQATQLVASAPLGVRLYVRVAAVNTHGAARSNEVIIAPAGLGVAALQPPVVTGSTVQLSWSPAAGATSYYVAARSAPGGPLVAAIPVNGLSLQVGSVPAGTYFVSIVAVRGGEIGAESAPVTVTVP